MDPPSLNPSLHSKPFSKAQGTPRHATTNGRIPPDAQRRKPRPEAPGSDAARQPPAPHGGAYRRCSGGHGAPGSPVSAGGTKLARSTWKPLRQRSAARPGSSPGAPRSPARPRPREGRTHSPGASSWGPSPRGSWPCRRLWPRPSR